MQDVRTFLRNLQAEGEAVLEDEMRRELKEILKRPVVRELLRRMGQKMEGQVDGLLSLNFGDLSGPTQAAEVKGYARAVVDLVETAWEISNASS